MKKYFKSLKISIKIKQKHEKCLFVIQSANKDKKQDFYAVMVTL